MKQSLYNNFIHLPSKRILAYNAFTRRFAIFPDFFNVTSIVDSPDCLENSVVYEKLRQAGFLIEDNINEVDILTDEIRKMDFNPEVAELHVNPTLDCNFRCWYCYEEHKTKSEMSEEVMVAVRNYMIKTIRTPLKHFQLSFFGGEPLLTFDSVCKPLIEFAARLCNEHNIHFHVSFTTNSYLLTPEIIAFLTKFECGMQITVDGHRRFHNKVRFTDKEGGTYDKIITNVAMLADAGINVILRVNYTLGNINSAKEIVSDLDALHITRPEKIIVDFQQVWQDRHKGEHWKKKLLIEECGKRLKEIGIYYSNPDLHEPRLSSCYGDKNNYICINYNGDFFKCTARDFKTERRAGYLSVDGTLVWEPGHKEAWENAKFTRKICLNCRIAPICLGGCRQRGIELLSSD